jgi:hypothetical protein
MQKKRSSIMDTGDKTIKPENSILEYLGEINSIATMESNSKGYYKKWTWKDEKNED